MRTNQAVNGSVDWAVYRAVDWTVYGAVSDVVWRAVSRAVNRAVDRAVNGAMNKFYCRRVGNPARYLGFHHFDVWQSLDVVRVHCEEWKEGDPPTEYWGWVRLPRQPGGDPLRMIQPAYTLLAMCFPDIDYEIRTGKGVPVRVTVRVAVEG